MALAVLSLVLGAAALWFGGEQFVLGSSRVADRTFLPTIVVGIVVAGFGTSCPELVVSLLARARGETGIAIGNALGSNVANLLLVLPLATLVAAWSVDSSLLRREVVAVLGMTALVVGLAANGRIGRAEGVLLLVAFPLVIVWLSVTAVRSRQRAVVEREFHDLVGDPPARGRVRTEVARALIGLAIVVVAADRLVWGASRIATEAGLSDGVVGLTIVALGTSLPELVTSIIAARRGEPDLVLGNVLGSNLFNGLLVIGAAAMIGPLTIGGTAQVLALGGAAISAALTALFLHSGYRLTKSEAVAGLALYVVFVTTLFVV